MARRRRLTKAACVFTWPASARRWAMARNGARYIATLPGRGYCFVAPVSRQNHPPSDASVARRQFFACESAQPAEPQLVGRDDDVLRLSAQLNASRFVTIVGAGGVGKTTVAIAVGHHLIAGIRGHCAVRRPGNGRRSRSGHDGGGLLLGLSVQSVDATPNLIAYLRDKRILLVLDTCEHLVEAVATSGHEHHRRRAAGPHSRDKPRSASGRRRAYIPIGCACLSSRRTRPYCGDGPDFPGHSVVCRARRGKRRAYGHQRCRKLRSSQASVESSTEWRSQSN